MKKYNLIVVGGGFSGVAAAISAARSGLSVLLVERSNCLGGAATNCLVNPFMPYWSEMTVDGNREKLYLSQGLFKEILSELRTAGALCENEMTFHEEYLKLILNRMVQKEQIDVLFHSYLIDAASHDGVIGTITVANKSGNIELAADYFVDASGDGDLCVMCGCPYQLGREKDNLCQPMTLCFRVANVDLEKFKQSRKTINPLYNEMQRLGKIKNIREDVLIFSNLVNGVLHFNSTRVVKKNPTDAFDVSEAEMDAREQVFELFNFLTGHIDGFQNSQLLMTASQIGVRESRMIEGVYTLTGNDLIECKKFDDAIAVGNYDIDIHNPEGSGTSHYYFPDGQYYTIPYRSLIPKGMNNLLVAGRCISADHEAQASIRIIPIVCCIGEAAGVAVGIACKQGKPVYDADIKMIQDVLRERGAVV